MTDVENKGTLIAVSDGGANKLFVGWTEQAQGEIEAAMRGSGDPVVVKNARIIREITMPTPQGIVITIQVVPYSACRGGVDLYIRPTHFFWPNEADARKITELIAACEKDELKDRAKAAGHPYGRRPACWARRADDAVTLDELRAEWAHCERCDLCIERSRVVFGEGNPNADILIVGEAPGEVEDATGLPYQGDSGTVLNDFLSTTGLDRDEDIFVTNILGCRPTIESRDDRTGKMYTENRQPNKAEKAACWERLAEIIYQVDPLLIIAVGKVPAGCLLGRVGTIQKMRGRVFRMSLPGRHTEISYPVLCVFHTAYLLRIHDHRIEGPWGKTLEDFYSARNIIDHLREAYHGIPIPDQRRTDGR